MSINGVRAQVFDPQLLAYFGLDAVTPVETRSPAPIADQWAGTTSAKLTPEQIQRWLRLMFAAYGVDLDQLLKLLQANAARSMANPGGSGGPGPAPGPAGVGSAAPTALPAGSGAPGTAPAAGGLAPWSGGTTPNALHINQFVQDPNGSNSNCGPTSLAMALRAVGLEVPGATSDFDRINIARQLMCSNSAAKDGVDANGNRVDSEHSSFTNISDIIRGAEAMGASASSISPMSTDAIAQALRNGSSVVAAGAGSLNADGSIRNNYGHFVTVTGMDANGNFIVNDPTNRGPVTLTPAQLDAWLKNPCADGSVNNCAVAITPRNKPASTTTTTTPTSGSTKTMAKATTPPPAIRPSQINRGPLRV